MVQKLESTLEEINRWFNDDLKANKSHKKTQITQALLLKGQNLADQLNAIESVEAEITNLLNQTISEN